MLALARPVAVMVRDRVRQCRTAGRWNNGEEGVQLKLSGEALGEHPARVIAVTIMPDNVSCK